MISMAVQPPPEASLSVIPSTTISGVSPTPISSSYPRENSLHLPTINTDYSKQRLTPKRKRRPMVRLREIGHNSYYDTRRTTHSRRRISAYGRHKCAPLAAKTSRFRRLKKRPRTVLSSIAQVSSGEERSPIRDENQDNDDFQGAEAEVSSGKVALIPIQYKDDQKMGRHCGDQRATRAMDSRSESQDRDGDTFVDNNPSNAADEIQDIDSGGEVENKNSVSVGDWLISLGLGKYIPVFEIQEVDDEVLPKLSMENLKEMGIYAVGSRRKLYSAILKLRKSS